MQVLNMIAKYDLGKENSYYITKYVTPCEKPDVYSTDVITVHRFSFIISELLVSRYHDYL